MFTTLRVEGSGGKAGAKGRTWTPAIRLVEKNAKGVTITLRT
jgi:hypothetical protein